MGWEMAGMHPIPFLCQDWDGVEECSTITSVSIALHLEHHQSLLRGICQPREPRQQLNGKCHPLSDN